VINLVIIGCAIANGHYFFALFWFLMVAEQERQKAAA
jgi:hypothetical protein